MTGIIRAPRPPRGWTEIPNAAIRDRRLSYRARGILCRLLSNEDGYRMTAVDLARESLDGRTAVLSGLKELRECGYIVSRRLQDERGRWRTETYVFDQPQPTGVLFTEVGKPNPGVPNPGVPNPGGPDPIKKDQQNDQKKDQQKDQKNDQPPPPPTPSRRAGRQEEGKRSRSLPDLRGRVEGLAGEDAELVVRVAAKHAVASQLLADELIGRRGRTGLPSIENVSAWLDRAARGLAAGEEQFAGLGRAWRESRRSRAAAPVEQAGSRSRASPEAVAHALAKMPWRR